MSTKSGFSDNLKMIKEYQRTKDVEIRNQIIENNLSLIYSIIYRYNKAGNDACFEFEDLINEGVIGLISAIENFDPDRQTTFSTYATYWILKGISISFKMGTLSMPNHRISLYKKYAEMKENLLAAGQSIDIQEAAVELNVSGKILADTINQKDSHFIESLAIAKSSGGERITTDKVKFLSSGKDEEQVLFDRLDFEIVMNTMKKKLSDKENFILKGRFGIDRDGSMTLEQIAKDLGVSHEHVRSIQNRAIVKLRKTL